VLVHHRLDPFSTAALQVGVGDHLHVAVEQKPREVFGASISDSDSAERDSFTRRDRSVFPERATRDPLWNRGGRACRRDELQKATARKRL
jgi:hypothetical protein